MIANIFIIFVIAFILCEAAAKIYCRLKKRDRLYTNDPLVGWRLLPSNKVYRRFCDGKLKICSTNSKGLASFNEYAYTRNEGRRRVVIIGDSITEDFYNQDEGKSISQVLEAGMINSDVINMGCGGWSTDQEYLFFKQEGIKYAPDIAILILGDNDYRECMSSYAASCSGRQKPVFEVRDGELVLKKTPNMLYEFLRDHSYVFFLGVYLYNAIIWRLTGARTGFKRFSQDESRAVVYSIVEELSKLCVTSRVTFIVVRVYSKSSLINKTKDTPLIEHLMGKGILSVDCFDYLHRERNDIFYDYCHYNAKGSKIVADIIYDFISRNKL